MAGRSGVGRRTAVALVAHMHNIQVFTPKVSRGYGLKQFRTDLKSVSEREICGIDRVCLCMVANERCSKKHPCPIYTTWYES